MSVVQIETENQRRRFKPGETILGAALWQLPQAPKSAVLRLFWHTSGRGDEDVVIAQEVVFENPGAAEQKPFTLEIPQGPYSFSGRLVTLAWAIELLIEPGAQSSRIDIDVTPWDDDIVLEQVAQGKMTAFKVAKAARLDALKR